MSRFLIVLFVILLSFVSGFGQGPDTFFAVHCEPTHVSQFDALVRMVALADSFGAFLTIELSPQYADTILATPALLSQIRSWQVKGHEIAAHHHDLDYATGWDGYTNHPESDILFMDLYKGNMQDFFNLMSRAAGDSLLLTGGITDWNIDWPVGLPYRTEGHRLDEALTRPQNMVLNGQAVTSLGYGLVNTKTKLDSAKIIFLSGTESDVLGIVHHESDFDKNPVTMRAWLQFLSDEGGSVKTVRTILRERGYTTGVEEPKRSTIQAADGYSLVSAYSNPFNNETVISFSLPRSSHVVLTVYDVTGRRVCILTDRLFDHGSHDLHFGTNQLASGLYFIVMQVADLKLSSKVTILK